MEIYSGKRSDNKKFLFPTSFCRTRERSNLTLLRSPSRDPLLLLFSPIIPESFLNSALYFLLLNLPLFSEASGNEKMYCVERKSRGGQKSSALFRMKRAPFFLILAKKNDGCFLTIVQIQFLERKASLTSHRESLTYT